MISDDLVNSYHLLLCALDLVYGNALQCSNRKELVNPNFKGLWEDGHAKDFKPSSDPPCVIEKLCSLHDGLVLEAKGIKEHFWKPYVRRLYEKKLLKGKEENLTGFLEPGNFGENLKAINKAYEEYVLTVGNLDERVFLGEDAEEEMGALSRSLGAGPGTEPAERVPMKNILQQHLDKSKALRISTPLTAVRYIKDNSSPCVTPVSVATHSLSRLHTMLAGLRNAPSERLGQILRTCSRDPTQAIANRLKEMYEIYSQHSQPDEEFSNCAKEIASRHFRFAEMLYYKVLESIIEQEQKRLGDMDLSGILEQDAFHRSLLACCLEVVTFSYKPPGNFPFITEIFDVPLYHFYKVIEVFIRAEDGLCREVVKHLNQIEEQILDHLAWKPESPLWDRIRENDNRVPTCEEVMPPQNLERADDMCMAGTPLTPRRVSEVRAETGGLGRSITSPTTLYERYSSPTASSTRRRLFVENDSPSDRGAPGRGPPQPLVSAVPVQNVPGEAVPVTPVPGQTLVTMATATVTANNGQTVTIPVQGIANENGGITFFPVQVNVGGQASAVTGSMQPLSAQALAGNLSSQQVTGTSLQVPGQVAIQQLSPGAQQKQGPPLPSGSGRPRKTSSLSLFFRKVYHLAGVRLRDLCAKLDISDELRKKIWTCFEFSIVQCPELMMDRHLDQLLMCAIYVMAKVTKEDKSFQNIMRCYRTQPQARSQVYRSVLIKGRRKRRNSGSSESRSHQNSPTELNKDRTSRDSSPVMRSSSTLPVPQPSSAPPTPTRLTGANSDLEEEERGDLIQFYNSVYIKQIKTFALKYSQANMTEAPPLSPYPFVRAGSPRRVQLSQHHPVYISPHKHEIVLSPREKIFYYFSNSPSKRLREINSMIRTGETPTKKRGILLEDGSESPAKRICPENHTALIRRLQDVANDRGSH
ncbi:retinoblastoma-like protein 2 isoform X3 [Myotis daubentonii]|nr:retinoblastoma-like protein 2 isoform X3 [Myotis daubentonii]